MFMVVRSSCEAFCYMHDKRNPIDSPSSSKVFGLPVTVELVHKASGCLLFEVTTPKRRTANALAEFNDELERKAVQASERLQRIGGVSDGALCLFFTAQLETHVDMVAGPYRSEEEGGAAGIPGWIQCMPKNWNPWMDFHNDGRDMMERCKHVAHYAAAMGMGLEVVCKNPLQGNIRVL